MNKLIILILAGFIGLAGWIWLITINWKIALAVLLCMWGNNIAQKYP